MFPNVFRIPVSANGRCGTRRMHYLNSDCSMASGYRIISSVFFERDRFGRDREEIDELAAGEYFGRPIVRGRGRVELLAEQIRFRNSRQLLMFSIRCYPIASPREKNCLGAEAHVAIAPRSSLHNSGKALSRHFNALSACLPRLSTLPR